MTPHRKAYHKAYRKAHLAEKAAWSKAYRLKNLEKCREKDRAREKRRGPRIRPKHKLYSIEYRKKNGDRLRAHARKFYYENRERLLEWKRNNQPHTPERRKYAREWCRKNPAKLQAHRAKRKYAIETTETESKRINDFMLRIRAMKSVRCNYCDTPVAGDKVDFDHVIPLAKGGRHVLSNLCAACEHCNATKYSKLPNEWQKKGQAFLSL